MWARDAHSPCDRAGEPDFWKKMEIDKKKKEVAIRKGQAILVLKFLFPEDLEFSQTNKFITEPGLSYPEGYAYPDQWHLRVSTINKSKAVSFIVGMKVRSVKNQNLMSSENYP